MNTPERILITRTDRLGDVLLSLHAVRFVREAFVESAIDFLVQAPLVPVLSGLLKSWNVGMVTPIDIRESSYSAALCLLDEPATTRKIRKARVPVRVGNYSKLSSWLHLTHGLRQRRSLALKSEGLYNLELAQKLASLCSRVVPYAVAPFTIPVSPEGALAADKALSRIGIGGTDPFWVVHPGMGGSALNLSPMGYAKLVDSLVKEQACPVVLSMGPSHADLQMVEAILEERSDYRVISHIPLEVLAEVFRRAKRVIAPSTGPLHLAHYVGTPTTGIYSPVKSHHPLRWAPWGGAGLSEVLFPKVPCPGEKSCLGPVCKLHPCMERLVEAPRLQRTVGNVLSSEGV